MRIYGKKQQLYMSAAYNYASNMHRKYNIFLRWLIIFRSVRAGCGMDWQLSAHNRADANRKIGESARGTPFAAVSAYKFMTGL